MMANGYISQLGFTVNDVMNAFSGDVAFMTSNIFADSNNMPGTSNTNTKKGDFILNMHIGDRATFNKIMSGLVSKNILSKNGDQYEIGMNGGHDFVIEVFNNDLLVGIERCIDKIVSIQQ